MQFIYVMREQDKQKLLELGYELLKENTKNSIWCFTAKSELVFSENDDLAGIPHIKSNVLTF